MPYPPSPFLSMLRSEPGADSRLSAAKHVERVLVAVGLSERSGRTLECALAVARGFGSQVELVHVVPALPYPAPDAARRPWCDPEAAGRRLGALAASASGARLRRQLLHGLADVQIALEAERRHASLLVLGAGSPPFLAPLLLGSLADELLQRVKLPVLFARSLPVHRAPRILAALQDVRREREVLTTAVAWRDALGAELGVITGVRPRPQALCKAVQDGGVDLLIAGAGHPYGSLLRLMFDIPDISVRIARRCPCSVLAVPTWVVRA